MWLVETQMAADDKPMAGTVSMLASRFSGMKGSASPIKKESSPATATSDLKAAIAKVIEETKAYGDAKLGELVPSVCLHACILIDRLAY